MNLWLCFLCAHIQLFTCVTIINSVQLRWPRGPASASTPRAHTNPSSKHCQQKQSEFLGEVVEGGQENTRLNYSIL